MNMQDLLDKAKDTLDNAKNTLGLEPQETEAGIYIPSTSSLKIAAPNKTNYDHTEYDDPYTGDKKIMMVCTEEQYMTMENGNKFDTGNHPVEMMVPLLHFKQAGFDVDVFTPNGESVKVEQWAMPEDDDEVKQLYSEYESKFESPKSIGYKMVAFPTVMDKQMPKIGYLPGTMPWYFGEKLEDLGVTIDNKLVSGQTHQDRKLISGDGPLAANDFGKMSAKALLKEFG